MFYDVCTDNTYFEKATLNELTRIVCSNLFAIFKEKILTNLFYVELVFAQDAVKNFTASITVWLCVY